ncbi:hypothetical protein E4U46_000265 [Claviceps purpurea]|nr:hypothetical protein E4U46_000265 [Claviceps purpurea]
MPQVPTNDDDLASRAQSLGINPAAPIQQLGQETDTENTRIHPYMLNPQLKCFEKYISQDWYESEEEYLNLKEASTIQLNDRVIYSLHQYLEDETVGKELYRIACVDFADWDASVWTRVHPKVRKKFRKVMIQGGIMISNNGVPERLDEFIREGLVAFEAEDPSKQNTNILAVASQKPPFSSSLFSPTRTTQTMTSRSIADDKSHPIHPKLKNFKRYVSRAWSDSEDIPLNLETATQIELNDRVICVLDQYLEDEISHNVLLRRVCEDFQEWDESIWNRVRKEVRMEFRKILYVNGVGVDANLINDEDDTADSSEEDYDANLPELPSANRTDEGPLLDTTSSDSNKKEEKLPEEPASARPECVHFEEKQTSVPSPENPTADLDDKPCVSLSMGRCTDLRQNGDADGERHEKGRLAEPPDRQKIPADTRSTAPPVDKDPDADKVSVDPVQRISKDLKRGCPTEAAFDKDSVVDRALVVLPDPPDLQRRRSSDGERPAKSPDDKDSPENTLPSDPAVSKDLVAGVALNDPLIEAKTMGKNVLSTQTRKGESLTPSLTTRTPG